MNISLPDLICWILLVLFITLKALGIIAWGWGTVLIPLWILLGFFALRVLLILIIKSKLLL